MNKICTCNTCYHDRSSFHVYLKFPVISPHFPQISCHFPSIPVWLLWREKMRSGGKWQGSDLIIDLITRRQCVKSHIYEIRIYVKCRKIAFFPVLSLSPNKYSMEFIRGILHNFNKVAEMKRWEDNFMCTIQGYCIIPKRAETMKYITIWMFITRIPPLRVSWFHWHIKLRLIVLAWAVCLWDATIKTVKMFIIFLLDCIIISPSLYIVILVLTTEDATTHAT